MASEGQSDSEGEEKEEKGDIKDITARSASSPENQKSQLQITVGTRARVRRTSKIPPNRLKTANLNHHGAAGLSATMTYHGKPIKITMKRPTTKNIEPICRTVFILPSSDQFGPFLPMV